LPSTERPIWRVRDFRLLWTAQAVSEVGTGITQLAYPLLMLALTGSPAQAGALAAVQALPHVMFGLVAGALADRLDRRRLMIWCEATRGLLMLSIPVALWLDRLTPTQLYVTGFLGGLGYVLFSAAERGALPNVVSKEDLPAAVAAQQATSSASSMVGPALGGVLYGAGRALPFLTDALSYLISVGTLRSIRSRFQATDDHVRATTVRRDVSEGLRWLSTHPVLRPIALAAGGLQLAISGVGLVVIVSARDHHAAASTTGLLLAGAGVGGVAGAAVATRIKNRLGFGGTLLAVIWAQAGLWGLFAASPNLAVTGIVLVIFAGTMSVFGVAVLSYQLAVTPDHLRGRIGTAFGLILWAAAPLGAAAAGVLLANLTPAAVSLCFAGWVAVLAATCTATRALRQVEPAA
jgi:predicted MFS family arabinose efflux permease